MTLTRRRFAALAGAACLAAGQSRAQGRDEVVRLGVLTDMTGIFADLTATARVEAAQMAVEQVGGSVGGRRIEVVSADHQNKADVASAILRKWYDQDGSTRCSTSRTRPVRSRRCRSPASATSDDPLRRRHDRPHRSAMLAQHDPLDLGFLRQTPTPW